MFANIETKILLFQGSKRQKKKKKMRVLNKNKISDLTPLDIQDRRLMGN